MDSAMLLRDIIKIYDKSSLPTAAVGSDGNIISSNEAFGAVFGDNTAPFAGLHNGSCYSKRVFVDGKTYEAYVTALSGSESLVNISPVHSADEIIKSLASAVRHAVTSICIAADNLSYLISTDESDEYLNIINAESLTLMSEFLIPDEAANLRYTNNEEFPPCSVSEEMRRYTDGLSVMFAATHVQVTEKVSAGLYAAIDTRALKLIVSDYIVRCMEVGEYRTEAISVKLFEANGTLRLCVSCGNVMHLPAKADSIALHKADGYTPYTELIALMKEKFGCRFSYKANANFSSMNIEIPVSEPTDEPEEYMLHSAVENYGEPLRFSDENAYFSRFRLTDRYKRR